MFTTSRTYFEKKSICCRGKFWKYIFFANKKITLRGVHGTSTTNAPAKEIDEKQETVQNRKGKLDIPLFWFSRCDFQRYYYVGLSTPKIKSLRFGWKLAQLSGISTAPPDFKDFSKLLLEKKISRFEISRSVLTFSPHLPNGNLPNLVMKCGEVGSLPNGNLPNLFMKCGESQDKLRNFKSRYLFS